MTARVSETSGSRGYVSGASGPVPHAIRAEGSPSAFPVSCRSAGFTLVEILAVIVLIGVAMTLVAVTVGDGLSGARVKSASRDLVAAMRYTRGQAIVSRESRAISIDVEGRRYQAPERKWVELPKHMEMQLETARSEMEDDSTGRIRFFPDGASTGGNVELSMGRAVWRIEVNWLTGEVTLLEPKDLD